VQPSIDVGVVGAGTAGTAAALLLARAGHRVTLYERVPEPGPVGAGIVLQPTGQAVLQCLGLLPPVLAHGARIDRLRCVTGEGREVFSLDYRPVCSPGVERFGLGLHRGVLHQTLLEAVRAQPGIELRCGVDLEAPLPSGDRMALRTADGEQLGPHDLVVVADGARSRLREHAGLRFRERPYAWGALWHVAADPQQVYAGELCQFLRGTHSMLGLLPTGRGPEPDSPPQVSLFWSLRADRLPAFRTGDLKRWKDHVLRDDPRAAFVLESLRDPEQLLFAHYRHVTMPRWHGERIVLLGDAAHAMSPQLGQGCNLALCDAAVLADVLAATPTVPAALARYTRLRRAHLRYYLWATRALTPFFQSDQQWLGWLRDRSMPLATRVPWIRRRMCLSMAGHMRGVLRGALPLSSLSRADALRPSTEA